MNVIKYKLLFFICSIHSSQSFIFNLDLHGPRQIFEVCKDVCGSEYALPCSCSATCVVLNNCCENITHHCPEIVEEGRRLFDRQLTSEVTCTDYGNFIITSCPATDRNNTTNETVTVASGALHMTTSNGKDNLMSKLVDLYDNRPVEDVLTGLLYKNVDIFYCNTLQNTNYTWWNVVIGSNKTQDITKSSDILKFMSQALIIYKRAVPKSDRPICLNYAEDNCEVFKDLQPLCDSFISYVKFNNKYYKNRFCLLCNNITSKYQVIDPKDPTKWTEFIFSVTFEVNEKEHFKLKYEGGWRGGLLSWRAVTCSLTSIDFLSEDNCHVTQCPPAYEMRGDGQCWTRVQLHLGVGIETLPKSRKEEEKFSQFIACGVQTILGVDISSADKPTYSFYPGSKRIIFVTNIFFFGKNVEKIRESKEVISQLAEIGKTFLKYKDQLSKSVPEQVPSLNIDYKNEFFHSVKTSDYEYMQKVRQRVVFDYTVTFCFRIHYAYASLYCWEEPMQYSDDFHSENITQSSCFQSLLSGSNTLSRLNVHLFVLIMTLKTWKN